MAAKIIKGGGDVPARSLAVHARTPQVAGDKKVIDKELYSARNRAEEILRQGQQEMEARQQLGVQQAEEARAQARDAASLEARQEAVTAILAAYKQRGDALCAARQQCLTVANSLVGKITGTSLSLPPQQSLPIIDKMLKARRGKHAVVVALPQEDVDRLLAHAPLAKALEDAPEIQLQASEGDGALRPAGGEIPLEAATAARALCEVLGVPLPDDLENAGEPAEAAQEDVAEAPQEESGDFGAPLDEGTQALDAYDDDDLPQPEPEPEPEEEHSAEETDMATGSLDEEDVAQSLADDGDDDDDADFSEEEDTGGDAATARRPATRSDFLEEDDASTVSNAVNPMSIRSGSVISGVERLPSAGRTRPVEGTRVEGTPPTASRAKPLGAIPLEERSAAPVRPPPAPPVRSHHHNPDERSGSMRAPPPPRLADFSEDDDPSAATVAISRADLAAHHKAAIPARPAPAADPGTRVDVRTAPPTPPTRGEISGLQRKPR